MEMNELILTKFLMKFGVFAGRSEQRQQSINILFINKSSFVVLLQAT